MIKDISNLSGAEVEKLMLENLNKLIDIQREKLALLEQQRSLLEDALARRASGDQ